MCAGVCTVNHHHQQQQQRKTNPLVAVCHPVKALWTSVRARKNKLKSEANTTITNDSNRSLRATPSLALRHLFLENTHVVGEESQICLFGVCLLMTYVPLSPRRSVSTPFCFAPASKKKRPQQWLKEEEKPPLELGECSSASVMT